MQEKCKLTLKDGSSFYGHSFGAKKSTSGEVVFNTGMVGYPESMTDPSYHDQILVLTYPLIGNYGVPGYIKKNGLLETFESEKIQIKGLVVSEYCEKYSHWSAVKSLSDWMKEYNIPGISGVDTRQLTKILRIKGTMLGKLIYEENVPYSDPSKINCVEKVSIEKPQIYKKGNTTCLLIDCGAKHNIIRSLMKRNVSVIRVPWNFDFNKSDFEFDGIMISNGPGDPKKCTNTVNNIRTAFKDNRPIFGICLGNQLLGLAARANTYKLKFGHRSQNQPCIDQFSKRCYITSQNHGYAIDSRTLPRDWEEWFVNANDNSNEGIRHKKKPFFSVQFHPEAYPGPVDTGFLFDEFVSLMKK
jgi:carbamoyl-phosphate synthase small subunit